MSKDDVFCYSKFNDMYRYNEKTTQTYNNQKENQNEANVNADANANANAKSTADIHEMCHGLMG